jgi:hypothetical protein
MFIEMSEQLNQAKQDLINKVAHAVAPASNLTPSDTQKAIICGIEVVFRTLNGQLKSLEKDAYRKHLLNLRICPSSGYASDDPSTEHYQNCKDGHFPMLG